MTPILAVKRTQKERVLEALMDHDSICLADVDFDLSYCMRNRISELRDDGYAIEGEQCRRHAHRGPILRYRILLPQPVQQALPV
jgi:hypothetical protein